MTCFDSTPLKLKFSVQSLMVVMLLEGRLPETERSRVKSSLVKQKKENLSIVTTQF